MSTSRQAANQVDETKADAELLKATQAASSAPPEELIPGLDLLPGASQATLYLKSKPTTKKLQYKTFSFDDDDKPLLLTYFAIQVLGEVPKLMLAETGTPYECIACMGGEDQSLALEWRTRSPNGLLPTMSGAGIPRSTPISQSGTIIRFLAKRLGMDGDGDEYSSSMVDVLYETAKDLDGKKREIAAVYPETTAKDYSTAKGPFAIGKRLEKMLKTTADPMDHNAVLNYGQIQLFQVLQCCEGWRTGCVKENLGEELDVFRVNMENRPGLKEYLNSSARFPLTKVELGDEGYVYANGPLKRGDISYD